MLQAIARQHDDEGAVTVRIDVGRGVAKPGDVVVHGKAFVAVLFV
jgi:hypothetical protein